MSTETDVISAFAAMRRAHPQWRVGQLVTYVAAFAKRDEPGGLWAMEDEEFVEAINRELYENPTASPAPHLRVNIEELPDELEVEAHPAANVG